ncbi:bifunctional 2-polyprenyl-6-hydroxyphenol methylase/3-demethylubiquinol 3-O-methyltransferase UbiG [Ruegeria sp. HKCCD8929]|uniref:class I SAM-dependent methyltransferase n=1 Tax=Ruegeria sp. HKCCD8929 TaxID=2683006 RepID=UPI001488DF4A|nr:class I SAM-dependent methyltransferase [Ruegeria sp. HKCCD8929]
MERSVYDRMVELETRHWWFVARRKIIASLIEPMLEKSSNPTILEAGCGSGGNLSMLRRFGKLDAFEFDDAAREAARQKSGLDIRFGALPEQLPFTEQQYDLIGLFDVLEHIEADDASLRALAERLDTGGRMIVTVPAFSFLWSKHDERHHHFRRYTRKSLAAAADKAGLQVSYSCYFNTFLFPVAVISRALKMFTGRDTPDDALPPVWLNAVLTRVFGFERHLVRRVNIPFGLSLAAILEKA